MSKSKHWTKWTAEERKRHGLTSKQALYFRKHKGENVAKEDVLDSRLSKYSMEQLQEKLTESLKQVEIYQTAIDSRKEEEINKRLEELRALGWSPSPRTTTTKTPGTRKPREDKGPRKCKLCVAMGLPGVGHNARGHEKFMASQGK